ncbi:hypothetical protein WT54_04490 [Burkholderia territorii]|nr:hypothetical protein WT54_04490 [Burkholderia territorii]
MICIPDVIEITWSVPLRLTAYCLSPLCPEQSSEEQGVLFCAKGAQLIYRVDPAFMTGLAICRKMNFREYLPLKKINRTQSQTTIVHRNKNPVSLRLCGYRNIDKQYSFNNIVDKIGDVSLDNRIEQPIRFSQRI